MRAELFTNAASGRLITTIEKQPAFVPAALPPEIDLAEIAVCLAETMQAIGELKGACRRLPSPHILIPPFNGTRL